ncbi:MAG: SAM hydrolase/SAM-dependent halogenase family protein [Oceanidesulfovibrio sp.]
MNAIVLLTDFGSSDAYVAQMKGVLLTEAADNPVVDLSHNVDPRNAAQAGFLLASTLPHFPVATVFCCVVDPGVGTDRRLVCAASEGRICLAPDNGLLSLVLERDAKARTYDLTNFAKRRSDTSATFHGRDIFAPLAARLARGSSPESLGERIERDELVLLEPAHVDETGDTVSCHVLHVDRFGNAVLSLPADPWAETLRGWESIRLHGPEPGATMRASTYAELNEQILSLVSTYAELAGGEAGILAGSQGYMEIALNGMHAARTLALHAGSTVRLSPKSGCAAS